MASWYSGKSSWNVAQSLPLPYYIKFQYKTCPREADCFAVSQKLQQFGAKHRRWPHIICTISPIIPPGFPVTPVGSDLIGAGGRDSSRTSFEGFLALPVASLAFGGSVIANQAEMFPPAYGPYWINSQLLSGRKSVDGRDRLSRLSTGS